jgi:hypothetical protein
LVHPMDFEGSLGHIEMSRPIGSSAQSSIHSLVFQSVLLDSRAVVPKVSSSPLTAADPVSLSDGPAFLHR